MWVKGETIEIWHTYTVFTQYKNTKTGEVVSETTSTYTAKSKEDEFEVPLDLKADTLKAGGKLTATHILYYEEEQENEVGREDDLSNKEQTVTFKIPEQPKKSEEKLPEKKIESLQELLKTGSVQTTLSVLLGILFVTIATFGWLIKRKEAKNK